ncbi:MAG: sulfite exporter TauE/SafE family protein [Saccharofermentanales bacterium]
MELISFLVSILASTIGAISGIGGGVIIKPVMDATGMLSVSAVSFLSGCTVLSMTLVSVGLSRVRGHVERAGGTVGTLLAVGAVAGGIAGKILFDRLKEIVGRDSLLGAIQAALLLLVTAGSFIYTLYAGRIRTRDVTDPIPVIFIGLLLGLISSFLGIGGGPIHLTALYYFFSMTPKRAAINSLYIILLSQAAGIAATFLGSGVPPVEPLILVLMIFGGVLGGFIGRSINKKISHQTVTRIFQILMAFIIVVCLYNLVKFIVI